MTTNDLNDTIDVALDMVSSLGPEAAIELANHILYAANNELYVSGKDELYVPHGTLVIDDYDEYEGARYRRTYLRTKHGWKSPDLSKEGYYMHYDLDGRIKDGSVNVIHWGMPR